MRRGPIPAAEEARALDWSRLTETTRAGLERKLEGLYGGTRDEAVFNALTIDKQQALLIIRRRFVELGLWDAVRRIENLYGEGGVGMGFTAWPLLRSRLERRNDFSTWFARHRGATAGFIERGRTGRASLHLLGGSVEGGWEAHFDLYNPWASPLSAWHHLVEEKIRKAFPDWRAIGASLGYLTEAGSASGAEDSREPDASS